MSHISLITFAHRPEHDSFEVRIGKDRAAPRLRTPWEWEEGFISTRQSVLDIGVWRSDDGGISPPSFEDRRYANSQLVSVGSTVMGRHVRKIDMFLHGVDKDITPVMSLEPGQIEIIEGVGTHMNHERFDRLYRFQQGPATTTVHLAFSS